MIINEQNLELLTSNKYSIDCIKIKLTQQSEKNPVVYSGSGSITQKDDGNLHLKIFHEIKDFQSEIMSMDTDNNTSGKIIKSDQFFNMDATDMSGNIWHAKNISVSGGFSIPAAGKVVEAKIDSLTSSKPRTNEKYSQARHLFFIIAGQFKTPRNKYEELPRGGKELNITEFEVLGVSIKIQDRKEYLTINAKDISGKMDELFMHRLVEALSIIFGRICRVSFSSFSTQEINTITINSNPTQYPNKSLVSSIKHNSSLHLDSFNEFINKYMKHFPKKHDLFYGYWHKINRAWQGGIENAALAISTAIEGVTKHYFSEYGSADKEILSQAEAAKVAIKELDIGERIKERLLSSIGNLRSPNPKNALYVLASEGIFTKKTVKDWSSLRNKSAHADRLDDNSEEFQKYLDLIFKCLNLFYLLLFNKINYEGLYNDLSIHGWPEERMKVQSDAKKIHD